MRQFESVFAKLDKTEDIIARALARTSSLLDQQADGSASTLAGYAELKSAAESLARGGGAFESGAAHFAMEAIILADLRPPWFILEDKIEISSNYDRTSLVAGNIDALNNAALSVGRIDLLFHPSLDYAGTGWLITKDIAVTNRHVAELFVRRDGFSGWRCQRGNSNALIEAHLDFRRQKNDDGSVRRRVEVREVLYVAGSREPDFALLRVGPIDAAEPMEIASATVAKDDPIAAIGYPAWDGKRNDPGLMDRLFDSTYEVKRFSPGIALASDIPQVFEADYTSLGGNSGSAVIALDGADVGKVVGLHFAGRFRETNYAVNAKVIDAARRQIQTMVAGFGAMPPADTEAPVESFADRGGYDPDFLGAGASVPLPGLGDRQPAPVKDAAGGGHELKYTHFSVIQSAERRLPLVTAVNIDGSKAFQLKREGNWRLDGRMEKHFQIGNELYRKNALDRGHMVRRMDPGWGANAAEAARGEDDTFHYTNSAPQHEDLNQKDWVGLEDYILQAAHTRGFKACVMTGPVFRPGDRKLKHQPGADDVRIPEEFWKIAAMIKADTGQLSVTGYVLSHGPMIAGMTEASFVYGKYKTYQVALSLIEQNTGLDFGDLKGFDPLSSAQESLFGAAAFQISGADSMRF
jgi:endonuclease G